MMAVVKVQWDLEFARNEVFSFFFLLFLLNLRPVKLVGSTFDLRFRRIYSIYSGQMWVKSELEEKFSLSWLEYYHHSSLETSNR